MARSPKTLAARLTTVALRYPDTVEEFPWGERVVKVNKKVFVFLGRDEPMGLAISVKLPESAEQALALDCCEPTGHGLGRAGWVTIQLDHPECPPVDVLLDWLDESFRIVAPKRIAARLDTDPVDRRGPPRRRSERR